MRVLAFPTDAAALLADESLSFQLTADLSHWVVALERVPGDFPADGAWWPELLRAVAARTTLTHARVGSPREIQVPDRECMSVRVSAPAARFEFTAEVSF